MLKINDSVACPQCKHKSRVVWVSHDNKRVAIQCQGLHSQIERGSSKFGSIARSQTMPKRNLVFIVETEEEIPPLAEK